MFRVVINAKLSPIVYYLAGLVKVGLFLVLLLLLSKGSKWSWNWILGPYILLL